MTQQNPPSQPGYPGSVPPPPATGIPPQGGAPGNGPPPQGYGAPAEGYGAPAAGYGAPPAAGVPPAGGAPRSGGLPPIVKRIGIGLVGVAVLLGVRFAFGYFTGEKGPEVGDCVNEAFLASQMAVVDCGSDEAAWRVIGVHGAMTEQEFEAVESDPAAQEGLCSAFPGWESALWWGEDKADGSGDGDVFCIVSAG